MEQLVKQAKQGDKNSFTEIVLKIKDEAYKVAYCYLQNEQDSMDAVCSAVEKALLNIEQLKKPQYFKTWFIRITINESQKILRKNNKVINMDEEMQGAVTETHTEKQLDREDNIDLNNSLKDLHPQDRLIIHLKYYMGYTLDEIAGLVNLPEGTVRTRLYKNLKILRKKLEIKEVYNSG
ncbi:sigma-70 family RNA polymerase sigma factor [Natranaerobius thermophilus]|uniref:RNA polymerase, sigma-24 subunit, ECF subfamily n=1 Tax=Natranaerobius thermophilus (strain ATCC BAA-1301 / DSM 18059 / JW/NM-WN-LF) TaxID=457570 RepID=B2A1W3_NATTJ|nr:sigma-70 family RNA polymerase sigma factor [Natranaerobius thermophilus]ACB86160.1 RNA polymerase, sigma-24 subunit, ECF subfamily [Natranaerobius thermophilus JW/NM-WN-LF]